MNNVYTNMKHEWSNKNIKFKHQKKQQREEFIYLFVDNKYDILIHTVDQIWLTSNIYLEVKAVDSKRPDLDVSFNFCWDLTPTNFKIKV